MPHGNVLDVRVRLANMIHRALETQREIPGIGVELEPSPVSHALTGVLDGLPVVVNDEVGDVDVSCGEPVEGTKELLIR